MLVVFELLTLIHVQSMSKTVREEIMNREMMFII